MRCTTKDVAQILSTDETIAYGVVRFLEQKGALTRVGDRKAPGSKGKGALLYEISPNTGMILESIATILLGAAAAAEPIETAPATTPATTPVEGKTPKGGRNKALFSLGRSMRAKGAEAPEILAGLREFNSTQCHPPLSDKEVETITASVVKVAAGYSEGLKAKMGLPAAEPAAELPAASLPAAKSPANETELRHARGCEVVGFQEDGTTEAWKCADGCPLAIPVNSAINEDADDPNDSHAFLLQLHDGEAENSLVAEIGTDGTIVLDSQVEQKVRSTAADVRTQNPEPGRWVVRWVLSDAHGERAVWERAAGHAGAPRLVRKSSRFQGTWKIGS